MRRLCPLRLLRLFSSKWPGHCSLRQAQEPQKAKLSILIASIVFCLLFGPPLVLRLLPFPELAEFCAHEYSCRIYDRRGELVQVTAIKGGGRREFTPIQRIPKKLQKSFIRQEDRRFYFHHGVDWLAIAGALIQNKKAGKTVRGASTISMQLAKTVNQDNSYSIRRKLKDIFYAYRIEAKLSKKKILELYLNNIYFGANSSGVTSGARTYFGCELKDLSDGQIQVLSYIPRNPTYYNPVEHSKRFQTISDSAAEAAFNSHYFKYPFQLPHFVNYLSSKAESYQGHLPYELHTSIDLEISDMAQNFLMEALEQARDSRITNGSLLLLNNEDGSVISWLGNGDFFDSENSGQIDGVLVKNQPGSSMKPFLYALALEQNILQPSTVLADVPSEFGNDKLYIPENFNNRFNGPVRMRIALASSLNVPAVSTLNKVGVKNYLEKLYELGFESLRQNDSGLKADLGLALGAGEVSLYELVPAFSVFVRDGSYLPLIYTAEKNPADKLTNDSQLSSKQVFSKDISRLICSILSDKGARALGFGYTQTFQTDYPSIFKTGTSNQYQNIIALGATKNYTIGVWMGNFAGNTVIGKTGSSLPAWVAKNVLDKLEASAGANLYEKQDFPEPEGWHKERICSLSGLRAGSNCKALVTEYVKNGTELPLCGWHTKLSDSEEISVIYPPEYQQWLRNNPTRGLVEYSQSPLTVLTPKPDSLFFYSSLHASKQAIPFEITGGSENQLQVFYDEKKYATINRPFTFTLPVDRGNHSCRIRCGNEELTISFTVK